MKKSCTFLLLFGLLAAQGTISAIAQGQKFSCQAYGGAFVLDDTDWKALAESQSKLTREKFASLDATLRKKVCDSQNSCI